MSNETNVEPDEFLWPWERKPGTCIKCKEVAVAKIPYIGQRTRDTMWPLAFLRRLYSAPWRWTVKTRGQRVLCRDHGVEATEELEADVAQMRANQANFNRREHRAVALLNRGGIVARLSGEVS